MSYIVKYIDKKWGDCLCTIPTTSGEYCVGCTKEKAEQRVKELHEIGITSAYKKPVEKKKSWWNDPKLVN